VGSQLQTKMNITSQLTRHGFCDCSNHVIASKTFGPEAPRMMRRLLQLVRDAAIVLSRFQIATFPTFLKFHEITRMRWKLSNSTRKISTGNLHILFKF
jgi:hypothetical protein